MYGDKVSGLRARVGLLAAGGVVATLLVALPTQAQPGPPTQDVRVVNAPGLQRVQTTALVVFAAGETEKSVTIHTVPSGKRLVVEQGSFQGQGAAGLQAAVSLVTFAPLGAFWIPTEDHGVFAGRGQMLVGSEASRLYVDAAGELKARVILNATSTLGGERFEVSFAGYLVDVP
jgi:hypothetical protein